MLRPRWLVPPLICGLKHAVIGMPPLLCYAGMLMRYALRGDARQIYKAPTHCPRACRNATDKTSGGGGTPCVRRRPRECSEMPFWETRDVTKGGARCRLGMHKMSSGELKRFSQNDGQ